MNERLNHYWHVRLWEEALWRQCGRLQEQTGTRDFPDPDGALLVIALRNLVRAARLCERYSPDIAKSIERFEAALPGVKKMRDVIEHFDEYEIGTGWLPVDGTPGLRCCRRGARSRGATAERRHPQRS